MNKFADFISKSIDKKQKKHVKPYQYKENQSIVFLLDYQRDIDNEVINTFKRQHPSCTFYYIIFEESDTIVPKNTLFFHQKLFNWYGKLKNDDIIEFFNKEFDILVDFSIKKNTMFEKIMQFCKVSLLISYEEKPFINFIVEGAHPFSDNYIQVITAYLKVFK